MYCWCSSFLLLITCAFFKQSNGLLCERINVPACQGLGYNTTSMPNFIGQDDQNEATFKLQNFDKLLNNKCSPFLRLFMCSVFVPLCSEHVPEPVLACRSLCEEVHKNCHDILQQIGLNWPIYLNCSRFPEPPDLCMQQPSDEDPLETTGIDLLTKGLQKKPSFPLFCPEETVLIGDKCLKMCKTPNNQLLYKIWCIVWATLCFIFTSFALLTFMMDSKRFRWPARPLLYLAASGFVYSNILLLRFFIGSFTCKDDISLQRAYDNFTCVLIALLIVFIDFSYTLWWCALTYVWYLSASKEWSTESIERISSKIHLIIWTTSLTPIICALFSNKMEINDFTGFCQFNNFILTLIEVVIIAIGLMLALRTFYGLKRIRKALVCARRPPYKLDKLIYRLCIISLGVCLSWFTHLLCQFFYEDELSVEMLKVASRFFSFVFASFWVFSQKTFKSWNQLLKLKSNDKTIIGPITKV